MSHFLSCGSLSLHTYLLAYGDKCEKFCCRTPSALLSGGHVSTVNVLFGHGAKASIQNNQYQTPCTLALDAELHQTNDLLFHMFLNSADNINVTDSRGNTLLHLCYTSETDSDFKLILTTYLTFIRNGVHGNRRNNDGATALELCINNLYQNVYNWIPKRFPEIFLNHIRAGTDIQHMATTQKARFLYLCRRLQPSDMVTILEAACRCGFFFILSAEEEIHLLEMEQAGNEGVLLYRQLGSGAILSLKQMCASIVRLSLYPNPMVSVYELDLPQSLVNFIMCKL